ncbi:MAG: hypothetical protein JWL92_53 [Candidatus Nomurabacteria bacterium]|nr:hypothetical protein [Candidatus Nomurabacteria bacterium]
MSIPEPGFYYHYKHDELKGFNHYAYELTSIGMHSEDSTLMVVYYPLYKTDIAPANCFVRPIDLFFDEVEYEGKILPHFTKIIDSEIILKLTEIKNTLY